MAAYRPGGLEDASDPHAPGAPAIYLYRQVDRKDSGRANTEYNYVRIKILTEAGRENANVEIPYLSDRTHISNVRARTVHADGSVVNFDGKVYDKMVEKTKGTKIKANYHSKTVAEGNILRYTRTFEIRELSVPVNKIEDLKKFYRTIASDERCTAVLRPAVH